MTYVVIGLVLLIIIAPIFAILPSARQKEQMKIRKSAMGRGVSVEMSRIQDPIPKQDKYFSNTGQPLDPILLVMAYKMPRPRPKEWRLNPKIDWILCRTDEKSLEFPQTWAWEDLRPSLLSDSFVSFLKNELANLPDDVVKIQELNRVVTVFWHERSGETGLEMVIDFLHRCAAHSPGNPQNDLAPD